PAAGHMRGALNLTSASYFTVGAPGSASVNTINSAVGIAAWIKPLAAGAVHTIMSRVINVGYWKLTLNITGALSFTAGTRVVASPGPPGDGTKWVHVAPSYDGTTARLYVNGAQVAMANIGAISLAGGPADGAPGGYGPDIGGTYDGTVAYDTDIYYGQMDEIVLYNRGLTAAEADALARGALPARKSSSSALPAGADPPDRIRCVIGHQQRAVPRDRDAHRPSPHLAVGRDEAGQKDLVIAGRARPAHRHAKHAVAGAQRPVPRPVLGGEDVAVVLGGELLAVVEQHLQRGAVRLQQHVGNDGRRLQLGVLARVPRIGIAADVVPGPAVKPALLDWGDVVGDQVVAQLVALVDGHPLLARVRMHGDADGVADARREHAPPATVGRELEHGGAVLLRGR